MLTAVNMPSQVPGADSPLLLRLCKQVGDRVCVGETLFVYEHDGAAFEENSAVAGEIVARFYTVGDRVSGGVPIMMIEL